MKPHVHIAPLLITLTFPASAAWTYVDRSDGSEHYMERGTLLRDGQIARVWEVDDLATPNQLGVRSLRSSTEYDCEKRQFRVVYLSGHSGRMLEGTVVFASKVDDQWTPVLRDSLGELSMELACNGHLDSS